MIAGFSEMKREEYRMRLFIAVGLPRRVREGLLRDNALLRSRCLRGSFTREENLHLTLCFLGETASERLDRIKEALDAVSSPPLSLTVGKAGMFRSREGAVLWRAIEGPGLSELHKALSYGLEARGFPQEKRRFTPHLTIARRAVLREGTDLRSLSSVLFSSKFTAREITLFLSEQENGIRRYTPIYRKALGPQPDNRSSMC